MPRPSAEQWFRELTFLVAQRATCNRKQVGALLVKDGRIIGQGYNGSPPGEPHCIDEGVGCLMEGGHCVRTVHAEANAIAFAARKGVATEGATMYVTITPCKRCADIMKTAGIASVVFFEDYR